MLRVCVGEELVEWWMARGSNVLASEHLLGYDLRGFYIKSSHGVAFPCWNAMPQAAEGGE